MESAASSRGPWGRRVWTSVATLTAVGLIGIGVVFAIVFIAAWRAIGPGCQVGGGPPIYGFLFLGASCLVLLSGIAGLGLLMFRVQAVAGPVVLLLSNLVVMVFYGLASPVNQGQLWQLLILVPALAAAAAAAVLVWPLATRGRLWFRAVEFVILTLIALPAVWVYAAGVSSDIQTEFTAAPYPSGGFSPGPGTCE